MGTIPKKTPSNAGAFDENEEVDPELDSEEDEEDAAPDEEEFEEDDFSEGKSEY